MASLIEDRIGGRLVEEEDDEELFEIDLESVEKVLSPQYYWEGCPTTTSNALLANCLLPISDLSSAVPMISYDWGESPVKNASMIVMMIELDPEMFWGSSLALGLCETYRRNFG